MVLHTGIPEVDNARATPIVGSDEVGLTVGQGSGTISAWLNARVVVGKKRRCVTASLDASSRDTIGGCPAFPVCAAAAAESKLTSAKGAALASSSRGTMPEVHAMGGSGTPSVKRPERAYLKPEKLRVTHGGKGVATQVSLGRKCQTLAKVSPEHPAEVSREPVNSAASPITAPKAWFRQGIVVSSALLQLTALGRRTLFSARSTQRPPKPSYGLLQRLGEG